MDICTHCGREVELEMQEDGAYCHVSGWKQTAAEPAVRDDQAHSGKPSVALLRVAGVMMILLGLTSIYTVFGILDIVFGIGLMMRREKPRRWAHTLKLIQVVVGSHSVKAACTI